MVIATMLPGTWLMSNRARQADAAPRSSPHPKPQANRQDPQANRATPKPTRSGGLSTRTMGAGHESGAVRSPQPRPRPVGRPIGRAGEDFRGP